MCDGRITLGVDADLPAVAVGANDEVSQLRRLPVGGAGELAMRPVRLRKPGGAPDERAVRIELHRGDAQVVVPERRGNADRLEIIEVVRERHQGDT